MAAPRFNDGDKVVYPGMGVGTVAGLRDESLHGHNVAFLIVNFEVGMTLRIPAANIPKSGLRSVSSRRTMQDALSVLRGSPARQKSMWRHRALEYAAKIKSGDPRAIAEILRDLHRGPGDREASFSEKAIYQQAWERLIPEIAAAESTDVEAAAQKVTAILEAA